jgi:hypothetical protein
MYYNPEVAAGEPRSRSSNVFSFGCVFAEILTVVADKTLGEFQGHRTDDGTAFNQNLGLIFDWLSALSPNLNRLLLSIDNFNAAVEPRSVLNATKGMLEEDKHARSTALQFQEILSLQACCERGCIPFTKDVRVPRLRCVKASFDNSSRACNEIRDQRGWFCSPCT